MAQTANLNTMEGGDKVGFHDKSKSANYNLIDYTSAQTNINETFKESTGILSPLFLL